MDPAFQALVAAVGSFVVVTVIFGFIYLFCRRESRERKKNKDRAAISRRSTNPSSSVFDSASFDPSLRHISLPDLVAATRNFASDGIVGDGSFGFVYKAQLPGGPTVAVKRLDHDAFQGFREFRAEMETLGKIRHRNLVRILGYCISGPDRLLIYEFIERGSLDHWLHEAAEAAEALPWATRVGIVRGVATGLEYLHNRCEPRIIHRDIKASNVLLDGRFRAHIADFGLARKVNPAHSHVSTQVAGTTGYMPPEYKDGVTVATTKADVFSFGVLMLEVATGRRPNWPVRLDDGKEVSLTTWARKMTDDGRWSEMVTAADDIPSTTSLVVEEEEGGEEEEEEYKKEQVREYLRIACFCTMDNPRERPNMEEVVELLNRLPSATACDEPTSDQQP